MILGPKDNKLVNHELVSLSKELGTVLSHGSSDTYLLYLYVHVMINLTQIWRVQKASPRTGSSY